MVCECRRRDRGEVAVDDVLPDDGAVADERAVRLPVEREAGVVVAAGATMGRRALSPPNTPMRRR